MASAVVMPYDNHRDIAELRVISSSADINGSVFTDAIVQKHCSLHICGNFRKSDDRGRRERPRRRFGRGKNRQSRRPSRRPSQRADGRHFHARAGGSEADAVLKINLSASHLIGQRSPKIPMPIARPSSSATPMAAASIRSRMRWPNRAAERSLSPILPKQGAFVRRRRIPSSTFSTGCTPAPRRCLQSLMRNPSLTAQSSWPNGTLSSARTDGRAAVR